MKFFLTLLLAPLIAGADWSDYYKLEQIELPKTVSPEFGGLATMPDGRIAACFHSGEVMFYQPEKKTWTPFAVGLHEPLGIVGNDDGSVTVMQWCELTQLSDTDGDGLADSYRCISNDFGVSGNYHEFAYGPARDAEGNYYVSLNVASNFRGIFDHYRGPLSPIGMDEATLKTWRNQKEWEKIKGQAGRMFSRVPYRGCVLKITPEGKSEVFAYGFRSPNGLCIDHNDRLWITDNQGDWLGTSKLFHVEKDKFYGHPASLVWKPGWTRNPLEIPVEELDAMRTPAAGLFPQGELANSPTQPVVPPVNFGLSAGELLIGEMNQANLIRFLPDKIGGALQGTTIPFLAGSGISNGNNRFTFSKDGSLWAGKMHYHWAGNEGLLRITPTGKPMMIADHVHLKPYGFEVHFSHPLGDETPQVTIEKHTYNYSANYGSPKVNLKPVETGAPIISQDRRSIILPVTDIEERYLYTITLKNIADTEGRPLLGDILRYNVVRKSEIDAFKRGVSTPPLPSGWKVHDMKRPQPKVVSPGKSISMPPGDAIVLFDGTDLSQWSTWNEKLKKAQKPRWKVKDGAMEITPTGSIQSKQAFGDIQLHIEWATPSPTADQPKSNGNSGIFLMQRYELQVFNSWENEIYADGIAGSIYGQSPPLVNASRKPGEWQSYDIIFTAPRFDGEKLKSPARITVFHNGALIQNNTEILGPTQHYKRLPYLSHPEKQPILLQNHGDAVRYRNIWVREL
ncbi:family 16 glycoside hydrolase [Luteolibacter algae]|uniref:Family 16 glycoside hydrolase n=1 Tax=Luteolibacter algae TaxID=454151 RepID=A0ABW5D768_9BACT